MCGGSVVQRRLPLTGHSFQNNVSKVERAHVHGHDSRDVASAREDGRRGGMLARAASELLKKQFLIDSAPVQPYFHNFQLATLHKIDDQSFR